VTGQIIVAVLCQAFTKYEGGLTMILINSPAFICSAIALGALVGWLVGNWWRGRIYEAIWRDGANWALWYVRKYYIRLPRKLRRVLENAESQARGVGGERSESIK